MCVMLDGFQEWDENGISKVEDWSTTEDSTELNLCYSAI